MPIQESEASLVSQAAATANALVAATAPTAPAAPAAPADGGSKDNAISSLIVALEELVSSFTGTMQAFQERFEQLSDQEAALAAEIKKNMSQEDQLKYKAEVQDVQNEQSLANVAMQGASSNESTLLTMLGNTVKIYGNTLLGVVQSMSS